ncbi:hypothetical protein [Staphylococcus hominis]|uniref:hypothetical protein n=1 Tax=Staphylococcus hominis TaxID=1290 RepID=UPI00066BEE9A|nr:hypothetical protein [Staphylococcus hominis]
MDNREKKITVKLPESVLDLFKQIYNINDNIPKRKIVLYAIGSSLPERGRYLFAEDYSLDKETLSEIIKKRKRLTNENFNKDFKRINDKLDNLENSLDSNSSSDSQLQTIEVLLRLLLADNFSLGTDINSLNNYLNSRTDREIMNFAKNKI